MTRLTAPTTAETADLVTVADGRPMTDSLTVARVFGRRHDNVLRDIEALMSGLSAEFWLLNFEERTYTDSRGKVQRMLRLTQAGFAVAALGFTGRDAIRMRERFVTDFAAMADELSRRRAAAPLPAPAMPLGYSAALRALADLNDTTQRTTLALAAAETRIADQAPAVAAQARLATASGELCIRDAAKSLDTKPGALFERMAALGWIYRRQRDDGSTGPWRARQTQIDAGRLRHRLATYTGRDGGERRTDQVMVTPRGLAKLGELLAGGTP